MTPEVEEIIADWFMFEAALNTPHHQWIRRARYWALVPDLEPVLQLGP